MYPTDTSSVMWPVFPLRHFKCDICTRLCGCFSFPALKRVYPWFTCRRHRFKFCKDLHFLVESEPMGLSVSRSTTQQRYSLFHLRGRKVWAGSSSDFVEWSWETSQVRYKPTEEAPQRQEWAEFRPGSKMFKLYDSVCLVLCGSQRSLAQ